MARAPTPLPPKLQLLARLGRLALVAGILLPFAGHLLPWHLLPPALHGLLRSSLLIPLGLFLLLPGWIHRLYRLLQGLQTSTAAAPAGKPRRTAPPAASELPDLDRVLQLARRLQQGEAGGSAPAAVNRQPRPAMPAPGEQPVVRGRNTRTPLIRR